MDGDGTTVRDDALTGREGCGHHAASRWFVALASSPTVRWRRQRVTG